MIVQRIRKFLILLFLVSDDRLLVGHFVEESVRVGLELPVHAMSRFTLIIPLVDRRGEILTLDLYFIVGFLKILKVSILRGKFLAHRVLKMVK